MTTDPLAPLRLTAALAGWCGLLALVAAGLLSPFVGLAAGAGVTIVVVSCSVYQSADARQLRKYISFVILGLAAVDVFFKITASADPSRLAQTLPPLLIAVLIAQGLGADRRHDLMVSVTVGEFLIVLAAGVSPTLWLALPLVLGWLLAIVALVLSHQLHSADCSSPPLRGPQGNAPTRLGSAAAAAGLAMVIGLLLFLLIPPPSGAAAKRRLGGQLNGESSSGSPGGGRSSRHYTGGALDMRVRGDLGKTPVAEVPVDSPELWRARIYDTFDGTTWTSQEGPVQVIGRQRVVLPPDPLDEGVSPAGQQRTDPVNVREGFDRTLISPGTPIAVSSGGTIATLGAARVGVARGDFTVTSAALPTDRTALTAAAGFDVGGRWLQLPDHLSDRVHALAITITAGAASRPDQVQAISRYLGETKTYSLDSPRPPPGADAVEDFLFNSPTGFCEQFAAAQVILLRTLGIPARMATGFGYGEDQGNGRRLFRTANLHAWVEVWYPGIGWSPSDPTPPSVQSAATDRLSAFKRLVQRVQRFLATTRGRLTLAALIVALTGIVFALIWWRRRRNAFSPRRAAPDLLASSLLTAFARLEAALEADGRPRGTGETLTELERRLGADASGRRALATLELACYSPQLVTPEDARAAAHAFEALASSILAAHAARGRLADSIGVRR